VVKYVAMEVQMRKARFNEEQIISVLKEHDAGIATGELCRKHGISDATLYNWKKKYGNLTISEARRLKTLEDENRRLKHIVADQVLEIHVLKAVASKNF